jgi:hypothetical protein
LPTLGKRPPLSLSDEGQLNFANNLFASSCDNLHPIIAFGTCSLSCDHSGRFNYGAQHMHGLIDNLINLMLIASLMKRKRL